jgi:hypothetical protein
VPKLLFIRLTFVGYATLLTALLLARNLAALLGLRRLPPGSGGIGMHSSTFFGLAVLACACRFPLKKRTLIAVLFCYAAVVESAQFFVPPRAVEWLDYVENFVGLACGLMLWEFVTRREGSKVTDASRDEDGR